MNVLYHVTTPSRWILLPVLAVQGPRVRRSAPRLPEADQLTGAVPREGRHEDRAAVHVLVVGDSLAAGVGVEHHADSVAGQSAAELERRLGRPVAWRVVARRGATAGQVADQVLPKYLEKRATEGRPQTFDAVMVLVGVNDLMRWNSLSTWKRDLERLVAMIRTGVGNDVPLVFCGMPPVSRFPALPQPMRWLMGARAAAMDAVLADVASRTGAGHLRVSSRDIAKRDEAFFSQDRLHPSRNGYQRLAAALAPLVVTKLVERRTEMPQVTAGEGEQMS